MTLNLNTNQKLKIARIMNRIVCGSRKVFGMPLRGVFKRKGIYWGLDLNEGIDLSIYLLGAFEPQELKTYSSLIHPGDVILDIGANVGAHTLHFAQLTGPSGGVYAFEATEYAFDKMRENLRLNPELAKVVEPWHALLNSGGTEAPSEIYSSWRLDNESEKHQHHGGSLKKVGKALVVSLDDFVAKKEISKIDFIKLDVDGNEYDILLGAKKLLAEYKPTILMELSPHVHDERDPLQWNKLIELLVNNGYIFINTTNKQRLNPDPVNLHTLIPKNGSINVLLTIKEVH